MRAGLVVFAQHGCGACEEFLPRVQAVSEQFADVPVRYLDASKEAVWDALTSMQIEETPATVLVREGEPPIVETGQLLDSQLTHLFWVAENHLRKP